MSPEARIACRHLFCRFHFIGDLPDLGSDNVVVDYDTRKKLREHHEKTRPKKEGRVGRGHDGFRARYTADNKEVFVDVSGAAGTYFVREID